MKYIFYLSIIIAMNYSCNSKKNNDIIINLENELDVKTREIETLKDSIEQLFLFKFNKFEPLAIAYSPIIKENEDLNLLVGHFAYNTLEDSKVQYWVDDSTHNPETMKTFFGQEGNGRIKIENSKNPEYFTRGEHFFRGKIERTEKGGKVWGHWIYNYIVE